MPEFSVLISGNATSVAACAPPVRVMLPKQFLSLQNVPIKQIKPEMRSSLNGKAW
jgi:hypothetical protein